MTTASTYQLEADEPRIGATYVITHSCLHQVRYRIGNQWQADNFGGEFPAPEGLAEPCANCDAGTREQRERDGLDLKSYDAVEDGVLAKSWDRSADRHREKPLSVRIPAAERSALQEYAERHGMKVNAAVLRAIRELLSREEQPAGPIS
jgi:hypothetical protein